MCRCEWYANNRKPTHARGSEFNSAQGGKEERGRNRQLYFCPYGFSSAPHVEMEELPMALAILLLVFTSLTTVWQKQDKWSDQTERFATMPIFSRLVKVTSRVNKIYVTTLKGISWTTPLTHLTIRVLCIFWDYVWLSTGRMPSFCEIEDANFCNSLGAQKTKATWCLYATLLWWSAGPWT